MGIFDRFRSSTGGVTASVQEATAGVLMAVMASDGKISSAEEKHFGLVMNNHPFFRDQSVEAFDRMLGRISKRLSRDKWSEYLAECASAIPADRKAAVFALAVDLAFSDGTAETEEDDVLVYVAEQLSIDPEVFSKIAHVLAIKNGMKFGPDGS